MGVKAVVYTIALLSFCSVGYSIEIIDSSVMKIDLEKYDIKVNLDGGGPKGQAEALRLAISRALLKIDEETKECESYTDVLNLKIIDPMDQDEIECKINILESSKELAINNGEFEMAAIIRGKIRALINRNQ